MSAEDLESGYWRAYRDFYRWGSILRGACRKPTLKGRLRHAGYAAGWKKFEPLWDLIIKARRASSLLPVLEAILTGFGRHPAGRPAKASEKPLSGSVRPLARPSLQG